MSRLIVLDASAALEVVLSRPKAEQILDLFEEAITITVPDLYDAEVANALWKHHRAGDLSTDEALSCLRRAQHLVSDRHSANDLAKEALATSMAYHHPIYDALYAVVARRCGASVCTLDRRLVQLLETMRVPTVQLAK